MASRRECEKRERRGRRAREMWAERSEQEILGHIISSGTNDSARLACEEDYVSV